MRKGIQNRTQMTGKLVRMVHILLIKVLRRNAIFVMKLTITLQQLVQEELKLYSILPTTSLLKWTPKERFQELRRKGYCFQCLFPGAQQSTGKHSDRKCQRNFICKNVSDDKYPTKKHVMVCHKHRGTTENEQLLLEYKKRCIMKQAKLAAFSRDLKLKFHMNQQPSISNLHSPNH